MMNETNKNTKGQDNWEKFLVSSEENGIFYLEGVNGGESHVIAAVDKETGKIFYSDPVAREDDNAQELIQALTAGAKKMHPYSISRLEALLAGVVDFECEEMESGEGSIGARGRLSAMGFFETEMVYFGFPEEALED